MDETSKNDCAQTSVQIIHRVKANNRDPSLLTLQLYTVPTGHTTLLRLWINVNDVDSKSQQRRVASG